MRAIKDHRTVAVRKLNFQVNVTVTIEVAGGDNQVGERNSITKFYAVIAIPITDDIVTVVQFDMIQIIAVMTV